MRFTRFTVRAVAATLGLLLLCHSAPAEDGEARSTLPASYGDVLAVAFAADGKTLACGCGKGHFDDRGEIQLWDPATGKARDTLKGHGGAVLSLAFSADGKTLASGSADTTVRVWDTATWKDRATLRPRWFQKPAFCVALSRDGKLLASGSSMLRMWGPPDLIERAVFHNLKRSPKEAERRKNEHTDVVQAVAFSADDVWLASGGWDGAVMLWDVSKAKEPGEPDDPAPWRRTKWDERNGKLRFALRGPIAQIWSVAFSPDGKTLAAAYEDGNVVLWDPTTGKERSRLGHAATVKCIAIAPDGGTLAAGCEDGTLKLWDLAVGKERTAFKAHASITSVAFAPDGKTLASAGDQEAKLWNVAPAKRGE